MEDDPFAAYGGFVGAIAFAALVLILQSPDRFSPDPQGVWVGILVVVLSATVFFALFGSMGFVFASERGKAAGWKEKLAIRASLLTGMSVGGMMVSVPMMLVRFNWVLAVVVGIIGVATFLFIARATPLDS